MNTSVAASSIALGECNSTNGIGSVALGRWNIANADSSLSTGWHTTAWGNYSQAGGFFTNANSYSSVALGQYNAAMGTETVPAEVTAARTTWRGSDSLFVIGNGTGDTARSNALALKKNGELTLKANSSGPAIVLDPNTSTITINGHPINVQSGALCIDSQPLVLQGDSIVKADSLAIGIPVTHNGNANVTPLTVSAVYDPYQNGGKVTSDYVVPTTTLFQNWYTTGNDGQTDRVASLSRGPSSAYFEVTSNSADRQSSSGNAFEMTSPSNTANTSNHWTSGSWDSPGLTSWGGIGVQASRTGSTLNMGIFAQEFVLQNSPQATLVDQKPFNIQAYSPSWITSSLTLGTKQEIATTDKLRVVGNTTLEGNQNVTGSVAVEGDLTVGGLLTVQPRGGISMGIYQ
jgi:hypothetical protein